MKIPTAAEGVGLEIVGNVRQYGELHQLTMGCDSGGPHRVSKCMAVLIHTSARPKAITIGGIFCSRMMDCLLEKEDRVTTSGRPHL